jgi:hypothetical protein
MQVLSSSAAVHSIQALACEPRTAVHEWVITIIFFAVKFCVNSPVTHESVLQRSLVRQFLCVIDFVSRILAEHCIMVVITVVVFVIIDISA